MKVVLESFVGAGAPEGRGRGLNLCDARLFRMQRASPWGGVDAPVCRWKKQPVLNKLFYNNVLQWIIVAKSIAGSV
ncbi:hypothetical protein [Methylobacterium sp. Leaf123]|uniref:hypothetical protein n=1 Tax=Methylobacterium sp. Leaf123 TaxID=1736264 RepID=UPI0012E824F4|nr:hypothetical protein [Methylobacterium sp. Leaf123]